MGMERTPQICTVDILAMSYGISKACQGLKFIADKRPPAKCTTQSDFAEEFIFESLDYQKKHVECYLVTRRYSGREIRRG